MVPNSLQLRLIDLRVKQIDRRLLFSVHTGVWWRQTALIKLTVHHNCFFWRNKDYNAYRDWGKKSAFTIRAQERKGQTFAVICSQFATIFALWFLKHLLDTFTLPSYILLFSSPLLLALSSLLSSLIGWTAKNWSAVFKGHRKKQKAAVKVLR